MTLFFILITVASLLKSIIQPINYKKLMNLGDLHLLLLSTDIF